MMGVFHSPLKNYLIQEHNFDISIKTFTVGIISVFKTWFLALLTSSTSSICSKKTVYTITVGVYVLTNREYENSVS